MLKNQIFILVFLIFLTVLGKYNAHAQKAPRSFNKKIERAEYFVYQKKYNKAEKIYANALYEFPHDIKAIRNYIELFALSNKNDRRKEILKRVANQNYIKTLEVVAIPLLNILEEEEETEDLNYYLMKFQNNFAKDHPIQKQIQFYNNAENYTKASLKISNLGLGIQDSLHQKYPQLAFKGQKLLFTQSRSTQGGEYAISSWDSCYGWNSSKILQEPFNSRHSEESIHVSWDGRYIFFTRCGMQAYRQDHGGNCDIYFSYYQNNNWSLPQPLGPAINTNYDEMHPFLSSDQKTLYFSSNRPGGKGGYDLYKSEFKNGVWTEAVLLKGEINTEKNELAPFLSPDQKQLFFSSDGHPGYGGFDLFEAVEMKDGTWQQVNNLGKPINSHKNELACTFSISGDSLIFSSDRKDIYPGYNLFLATGNTWFNPHQMISGFIIDSVHEFSLPNTVFQEKSNRNIDWPVANRGDGSYYFLKPQNEEATILVTIPGYLKKEKKFEADLKGNYLNFQNIALLSQTEAAKTMDTLNIRVPLERFDHDFMEYFQTEWPDIYHFLHDRGIKNITIEKFNVLANGKEEKDSFSENEKTLIINSFKNHWPLKENILFTPSDNFENTTKNLDKKPFVQMHIIAN